MGAFRALPDGNPFVAAGDCETTLFLGGHPGWEARVGWLGVNFLARRQIESCHGKETAQQSAHHHSRAGDLLKQLYNHGQSSECPAAPSL